MYVWLSYVTTPQQDMFQYKFTYIYNLERFDIQLWSDCRGTSRRGGGGDVFAYTADQLCATCVFVWPA
jgi:hypothetical protein